MHLSTLLQFFPGHLMPTSSGLFPRNFKKAYPVAVRGEGCWIIADDGRRFLDASGQAAVVSSRPTVNFSPFSGTRLSGARNSTPATTTPSVAKHSSTALASRGDVSHTPAHINQTLLSADRKGDLVRRRTHRFAVGQRVAGLAKRQRS